MLSTISKWKTKKEIIIMRKKRTKIARQKRLLRRLLVILLISFLILVGFVVYGYATEESRTHPISRMETSQVVTYDSTTEAIEPPMSEPVETKDDNKRDLGETPNVADIVEIVGNVTSKDLDSVYKELFLLPDGLVEYFLLDGWKLRITDEDIAKVYFDGKYNSVLAATIYTEKLIVVENRSEAIASISHKFGHYLDYINGLPLYSKDDLPSLSSEFKEIASEEMEAFKSNIPNSSCVRNTQEFYAETFYYYITCPSKCTPKALEFIKSQIDIFQKRCSL